MAEIIERERIGLQYVSNDADDLCRCLIQLAGSRSETEKMGDNARRLFRRDYSSDVIYPKLLEHLLRVAGRRNRG
jgi:glycosyltransferase involved in cell wall biosynthesis